MNAANLPYPRDAILLVDDEASLLRSFDNTLRNEGLSNVLRCSDSREVAGILAEQSIGIAVLDLSMPHVSGQELLSMITSRHPDIPVIVVTAATEVDTAVACMKQGAFDYMVKPVGQNQLVVAVTKAIEFRELRDENAQLKQHFAKDKLENPQAFAASITQDDKMLSLFMYVESIAPSSQPVFITGETGVGKELVARATHELSRRTGRFVSVNVAGLDDNVFADTLFGHLRGAYTGADTARAGLAETAADGTLFLDEIGDLSAAAQVKLLRFLQEGEYFPLGSDTPKKSNARVIVSTNRDVRNLLAQGKFREDVYFRLLSHHIRVPPLRERLGDLPLLVDHFLDEASKSLQKKKPTPPPQLVPCLSTYHFPGNIRELRALVHDAVSNHHSGVLSLSTFLESFERTQEAKRPAGSFVGPGVSSLSFPTELPTVREAAMLLVKEGLRRTGGNQMAAARLLGVSRQTMNRYCRELKVTEKVSTPPQE